MTDLKICEKLLAQFNRHSMKIMNGVEFSGIIFSMDAKGFKLKHGGFKFRYTCGANDAEIPSMVEKLVVRRWRKWKFPAKVCVAVRTEWSFGGWIKDGYESAMLRLGDADIFGQASA